MYSPEQLVAVKNRLREHLLSGSYEPYEIVIAVLAMYKSERIAENQIAEILKFVFQSDTEVLKALAKAKQVYDSQIIDRILDTL